MLFNYNDMSTELKPGYDESLVAIKEYFFSWPAKPKFIGSESPLMRGRVLAKFYDGFSMDAQPDYLALQFDDGSVVLTGETVGGETIKEIGKELGEKTDRPVAKIHLPKSKIAEVFHTIEGYRLQRMNSEGVAKTEHEEMKAPGWKDD